MTRRAHPSRCRARTRPPGTAWGALLPATPRTSLPDRPSGSASSRPTFERWRRPVAKFLILTTLVLAGYGIRDLQSTQAGRFTAWVPSLDHFLSWDSFSEVEQTRSLLRALCVRSIAQIRADYLSSRLDPPVLIGPSGSPPNRSLDPVIDRLHNLEAEFAGTPEETLVQRELLRVFRRAERHEEWLDVFLRLVYLHPTDRIVAEVVPRAVEIGRILGRQTEVQAAIDHRAAVPQALWPSSPSPSDIDPSASPSPSVAPGFRPAYPPQHPPGPDARSWRGS